MYTTPFGSAYQGDSLHLLQQLEDESVDLAITSPPFALQRQKEYGNESQDEYVDWLASFAAILRSKLKETGSFVLDIGGAYERKVPVRSLYNFKVAIKLVEELGFYLAQEFFWFNPSKLPSPIEWVNKRKIRVKDAVNMVWWFSKSPYPKADVTKVLVPYSERMKKLLEDREKYYRPKERPSGHDISEKFAIDNGGAIPPNLLQIPNSESNSWYLRCCKAAGVKAHPARFPTRLPAFFIQFLTDKNDLVLDFFAGSNATGEAAEQLERRWLAFELNPEYVAASAFRFFDGDEADSRSIYQRLLNGEELHFARSQSSLELRSPRDVAP